MYDDEFVIRDFVKQNAEEWDKVKTLEKTITEINEKTLYERYFKGTDVGCTAEYLAIAFIKYWDGDFGAAARMAEGIKRFIESEEKKNV